MSLTLCYLNTLTENLIANAAFVMSSGYSVALSIYRVSHGNLTFFKIKKQVEIQIKFLFFM
jgi:hypothetical protein